MSEYVQQQTANNIATEFFNASDEQVEYGNKVPEGMTLTENGALTHDGCGDAVVDMFFQIVRGITEDKLNKLLTDAIAIRTEPNLCAVMQVIANLRDCRNGKGERKAALQSLMFIREHMFDTYARNLYYIVRTLGRYKDLIDLACMVLEEAKTKEVRDPKFEVKMLVDVVIEDIDLLSDDVLMKKSNSKVSLAGKWLPRRDNDATRPYRIYSLIRNMLADHYGITTNKDKWYRTEIIKPLAEEIKVVETMMSSGNWDDINFSHVPTLAMKRYSKKAFPTHCREQFIEYLKQVKSGESKINTAVLTPYDCVRDIINGTATDTTEVQWNDMLTKAKVEKQFNRTVSVVDVSGSMYGQPMEVAIALGLFTSLLSDPSDPFHKKVITFHDNPTFHTITGNTLQEMVKCVLYAPWGINTNFNRVFDMIIEVGKKFKLTQEQMPEQVVVYSDMEFDEAESNKTNFEVIKSNYEAAGYDMPKMVFWNLRSSSSATPVRVNENGTALLSGFSHNLLKGLASGEMNPKSIMMNIIKCYDIVIEKSDIHD
jgi:hypothetical protein